MIMNCFLSNVVRDFVKGHPPVGISTRLFLLVLNMIHKICKSQEKQMILDFIVIV